MTEKRQKSSVMRPSILPTNNQFLNLKEVFKNKNLTIKDLIEVLFEAKCDDL